MPLLLRKLESLDDVSQYRHFRVTILSTYLASLRQCIREDGQGIFFCLSDYSLPLMLPCFFVDDGVLVVAISLPVLFPS